jgi:hypothetical protein
MSTNLFREAYLDCKYLREKCYPEKALLKLVGDRYRLTRTARNCLFRGVMDERTAAARRGKLVGVEAIRGNPLGVDWYNILITVESYFRGHLMFIGDDGLLRDSSAAHGSFRKSDTTEKAIGEIVSFLAELRPARLDAFIDSPIAFSALMAEELRTLLIRQGAFPSAVELERSADYPLKAYDGLVSSSDSIVVDSARRIFDLPRSLLERRFGFTPLHVRDLGSGADLARGILFESGSPSP